MADPSLSEVHADLVGRLEQDKRLRVVEQQASAMSVAIAELPRMEQRLKDAISDLKPKSPWPAVSALAGVLGVFLVIAAVLYQK